MTDLARARRDVPAPEAPQSLPRRDVQASIGTDVLISLLTGGDDRSYALGLTESLTLKGVRVEFIGSDNLDAPELRLNSRVRFLNLRGDQTESVSLSRKIQRLGLYYLRLVRYAAAARPRIFHILWNNKFEFFDRTLLMLYYRMCGRRVLLTAHNVNAAARDGRDSVANRFSLRMQYRLCDHIFVHTERMEADLRRDFGVAADKISVIPFGINNTAPNTALTRSEARARLGVAESAKVPLFFGQIAPYKGLEYLAAAVPELVQSHPDFTLLVAGKPKKGHEDYWHGVQRQLAPFIAKERVLTRIEHIPDSDIEVYFKAADVLVIPYTHIFQSGVPFLAYSFGLPVVVTDVGALKDDVIEGETGFVCEPRNPVSLAKVLKQFFGSELYKNAEHNRVRIAQIANERHSWQKVAAITRAAYERVLGSG